MITKNFVYRIDLLVVFYPLGQRFVHALNFCYCACFSKTNVDRAQLFQLNTLQFNYLKAHTIKGTTIPKDYFRRGFFIEEKSNY